MRLNHPELVDQLRRAYSAEKAAAYAYIGHANAVRAPEEKAAIKEIENDEWNHRAEVLAIMQKHEIPISNYYEWKYYWIGKTISLSCYLIGWFMPFYFAGRLESGNVCEYFRMMRHFDKLGIDDHHLVLYEMGMKEKEHEVYFLKKLQSHRLLPLFEKIFFWGNHQSFNDVDMNAKYPLLESMAYCQKNRVKKSD